MVDVVGMKRTNGNLPIIGRSCVLEHHPCHIFRYVQSILSNDTVDLGWRWWLPSQIDVGGVERHSSEVGGVSTRGCGWMDKNKDEKLITTIISTKKRENTHRDELEV